jgi:hypothetical protein
MMDAVRVLCIMHNQKKSTKEKEKYMQRGSVLCTVCMTKRYIYICAIYVYGR